MAIFVNNRDLERKVPKTYEHYILKRRVVAVVFYEELRKQPLKELRRMIEELGFEIDPERFSCVKKHIDGSLKKRERTPVSPFTEKEKFKLQRAMAFVVKTLSVKNIRVPNEYLEYIKNDPLLMEKPLSTKTMVLGP